MLGDVEAGLLLSIRREDDGPPKGLSRPRVGVRVDKRGWAVSCPCGATYRIERDGLRRAELAARGRGRSDLLAGVDVGRAVGG